MFTKFNNIDDKKRERILNAAIKEFSLKGYAQASTNEIVKASAISKGILFHYFNNKKQLYLYVYDYGFELLSSHFYNYLDRDEPDVLKRLEQSMRIKLRLLKRYPHLFLFFERAIIEDAVDVKKDLEERKNQQTEQGYQYLYNGIDLGLFKDDIDTTQALKVIVWSLEGISNQYFSRARATSSHTINYEDVFGEVKRSLDLFRTCFYKEGEGDNERH
ncbi:TetR/AcrR family transcriptional regulator [Mechercharimyces sp. CAU 1602]|uniref:TetR/AcrR family transcriptional regulator n=1 Tax=Mechercharimyces sp. CAU 1602 TaxID=2973933 RepID=UPI002161D53F|nr:TetR/AcrR family transcriptional regulator [Mechercharimyces sp. CAU 1602]MCS1351054.1 TetR/AcrR family transcriptional regulator [Mechercharimyces sp. CAU 1602]